MKKEKITFKVMDLKKKGTKKLVADLAGLDGVLKTKINSWGVITLLYDEEQTNYSRIYHFIRKQTGCEVMTFVPLIHQFPSGLGIFSIALNVILIIITIKFVFATAGNTTPVASTSPAVKGTATFQITDKDHVRGNKDAKVTLVEFSDFECPYCFKFEDTVSQILKNYPDKVRLVYKYFPLTSIHKNSQKAAEAAECANDQNKFWEYHDALFAKQAQNLSVDLFKSMAGELGLNQDQFNSCLDSDKYLSRVQDNVKEGQADGVTGTPATFVNGKLLSGAQPIDAFKQMIDAIK